MIPDPRKQALIDHLSSGVTTTCHCWSIVRHDGVSIGFTDHDRPLQFDDIVFSPDTGLSARALTQTAGLAVDNTEVVGALSDDAITESDIASGRYDNAEVVTWLVNWADVGARMILFRGSIGTVTRSGGAFTAELRGLSAVLNQSQGRVFQRSCSAVLGDAGCRVDLCDSAYHAVLVLVGSTERGGLQVPQSPTHQSGWFTGGRLEVVSGDALGRKALIKEDHADASGRHLVLSEGAIPGLLPGDMLRLEAGCDKRAETCMSKFDNILNFRGFPDIPGDDWVTGYPKRGERNDGRSARWVARGKSVLTKIVET